MEQLEYRDYRKVNIVFYRLMTGNRANSIAEIPAESLQFMAGMEYWDQLRAILVHSLRAGTPVNALSDYWGVSRTTVRRIRNRYKLPVYQK